MKSLYLFVALACIAGCSGGSSNNASASNQTVGDPMPTGAGRGGDSDPEKIKETIGDTSKKDSAASTGSKKTEDSSAPTEPKKFEDSVFKVPVYPGATEVKYTRLVMDSDVSKSYNCSFQTPDDTDKVADFYKTEGAKVGKIIDLPIGNKPGTGLRTVAIEINDKEKVQVQATKNDKDHTTFFSIHYMVRK